MSAKELKNIVEKNIQEIPIPLTHVARIQYIKEITEKIVIDILCDFELKKRK